MEDNWREVRFLEGPTEINIILGIDAEMCNRTRGIVKDNSCVYVHLSRDDISKIHPIPGPIDEKALVEKVFEHLPRTGINLDRKTTMKILREAREARIKAFEEAAQHRRE